jgi:2'-5' RNA ligase
MSISERYTHATSLTGFNDWHQGIERYGFWAVLVDCPAWLDEISRAQEHVKTFIHPNYQRAPHITLSACGLIDEAYFSKALLAKQIAGIQSLKTPSFTISNAQINSFASAPYLEIVQHPLLTSFRSQLEIVARDNPALRYTPHITLGFYQAQHLKTAVAAHLENFNTRHLPPFIVNEISYCSYSTSEIQGPLEIEHKIALL